MDLPTASFRLRDRCAIVGIGATEFSRRSGRSELALAVESCTSAVGDAGLELDDLDGIVRSDLDSVRHNDLANALGLPNLSYWGEVGVGGTAPCGMVGQAAAAVEAGLASTVLVYRSLNGRSGNRYGKGSVSNVLGGGGTYDEYFAPYGLLAPGQMYAMVARRHMEEFGTKPEALGAVAITCRKNALNNPSAQMYGRPLDLETYRDARMIASPLRLHDFCVETDGAVAVIVTSVERARDLAQPPAVIRAVAQGGMPKIQGGLGPFPSLMRPDLMTTPAEFVARLLYQRAGLGPNDMDVLQLYDCFTITVLLQLEAYGFCDKGGSGPYALSGALDTNGATPINTAGEICPKRTSMGSLTSRRVFDRFGAPQQCK